ncbi:hypothetical protein [Geodermatophilus sp. URMC 64]
MTRIRRTAVLLSTAAAVLLGSALPAGAQFADTATAQAAVITTETVAPPTKVRVQTSCTLTTTTTKVTTDPTTGSSWSTTTTSITSTRSIISDRTTSQSGNTTTTTTRYTTAYVDVSWTASNSRGVTGYGLFAYVNGAGTYPLGQTPATRMSDTVDAQYLVPGVQLTVRTLTSYGWTADAPRTDTITC